MRDLMILTSAVLMLALPIAGAAMSARPEAPYVEGQVVVKFREGVPQERVEAVVQAEDCRMGKPLGMRIHLVLLPEGLSVPEAVRRFTAHPEVEYAEPNSKVRFLTE